MPKLLDDSLGPIGTILSSDLTLIQFQSLHGNGWVLANGTTCVGSRYSSIKGVNTVPDLQGKTVIGAGTGAGLTARTLGQTLGAETHILSVPELPDHYHAINTGTSGNGNAAGFAPTNNSLTGSLISGSMGQAHNNMQPSYVANFFIRIN